MFLKLFLLFTIVPVVELAILIRVGSVIGVLPTIAIVVLTGLAGAWLARSEGFGVLDSIRMKMNEGVFPADEMIEGLMILAAGLVLITPGLLTDITGFLLLLPPTRKIARRYLSRFIRRHMAGPEIIYREPF
jgi:UPF0716 protein FxsA